MDGARTNGANRQKTPSKGHFCRSKPLQFSVDLSIGKAYSRQARGPPRFRFENCSDSIRTVETMSKPEEKKRAITFTIPLTGYPRTMRFNRFAVEEMDNYRVFHCAYIGKQGLLCDLFSFSMANEDVAVNRLNILSYLDRMAEVPDFEPEAWAIPVTTRNVESVRIMSSSHSGNNAEIVLATFSLSGFLALGSSDAETKQPIQAQPLAMLTCETGLQKHVLTTIFIDDES